MNITQTDFLSFFPLCSSKYIHQIIIIHTTQHNTTQKMNYIDIFAHNEGSKSGDYEEIREKQFTKLLSNGSLLLQNVKEDREGFYLCQAHNGIGSGISKVIQLKVNCKYCSCSTAFAFAMINPFVCQIFI